MPTGGTLSVFPLLLTVLSQLVMHVTNKHVIMITIIIGMFWIRIYSRQGLWTRASHHVEALCKL